MRIAVVPVLVALVALAAASPVQLPQAAQAVGRPLAPPPAPAPRPPAPYSPSGVTVSTAERACLNDMKLLYPQDGKCYQLLSTGPCKAHEWLVLDDSASAAGNNAHPGYTAQGQQGVQAAPLLALLPSPPSPPRLVPVCARVPCAEGQVLWPRDGRCYQRFRDRETLCPHPGNQLVSNPFGLGECACIRSPPRAREPGLAVGECYPLYHRGPCPEGQLLVPRHAGNASTTESACVRDPCPRNSAAEPLVLWPVEVGGDGRCHPLGSSAPCHGSHGQGVDGPASGPGATGSTNTATFNIDPRTLRPGCITKQIYHLLPPTPCSGDRCSPTNTAAYSEGYIKELLQAHKAHRAQKRTG